MMKRYKLKKRHYQKITLKVGDKVKIIAGKHKNTIGLIKKLLKYENKVVVEDTNLKFKHQKPRKQQETGEKKQMEFPIDRSNVSKCED